MITKVPIFLLYMAAPLFGGTTGRVEQIWGLQARHAHCAIPGK